MIVSGIPKTRTAADGMWAEELSDAMAVLEKRFPVTDVTHIVDHKRKKYKMLEYIWQRVKRCLLKDVAYFKIYDINQVFHWTCQKNPKKDASCDLVVRCNSVSTAVVLHIRMQFVQCTGCPVSECIAVMPIWLRYKYLRGTGDADCQSCVEIEKKVEQDATFQPRIVWCHYKINYVTAEFSFERRVWDSANNQFVAFCGFRNDLCRIA